MRFIPKNGRVIVQTDTPEEVSKGGIILTPSAQEIPSQGTIQAVAPGHYEAGVFVPTEFKIGDKVLFGKYAGSKIKIEGHDYLILMETDIFGIVTPADSSQTQDYSLSSQ